MVVLLITICHLDDIRTKRIKFVAPTIIEALAIFYLEHVSHKLIYLFIIGIYIELSIYAELYVLYISISPSPQLTYKLYIPHMNTYLGQIRQEPANLSVV